MSTEHTSRPPETTPVTTTEARTMQATMQATVQDRYGEARDVLRVEQTIRPEIGADEVLLRVHAAGVATPRADPDRGRGGRRTAAR